MQALLGILRLVGRGLLNFILLLLVILFLSAGGDMGYGSPLEAGLKIFFIVFAFFLFWLVDRQIPAPKTKKKLSWRFYLLALPIAVLVFIGIELLDMAGITVSTGFIVLMILVASALYTGQAYHSKRKKRLSQESSQTVRVGSDDF